MTHRLATNFAKNFCNRTPIVKVIVENVVTCFLGHSVLIHRKHYTYFIFLHGFSNYCTVVRSNKCNITAHGVSQKSTLVFLKLSPKGREF